MSVIVMDHNLFVGSFGIEQMTYDMVETSDVTGSEAVRIFGPPRWRVSMAGGDSMSLAQAGLWEIMVLQLKRGVNSLAVYDPVRTLPQGTMRGSPVLANTAFAGDESVQMGSAAGTLLPGDWMQLGSGASTSQMVKVVALATGAGTATVYFEPPLRVGFAAGTAVTLDHPVFYARCLNKSTRWDYQAGNLLVSGFALDLLETFA